jgi:hypothetical protein
MLTGERRAGWLIDLANVKSDELSRAEKTRLRAECTAFLEIFKAGPFAREHVAGGVPFPNVNAVLAVSETDLATFQRWLKEGVTTLLKSEQWRVEARVEYRISLTDEGGFWSHEVDPSNDVGSALRRATYESLRDAQKTTRRCLECGTLFMRRRSQIFCSPRCGNLNRTRRWIAKHPHTQQ